MNDTLIINGITYKAVKEEKKPERLKGYTDGYVSSFSSLLVHAHKNDDADICMVELRSGEIIISERELELARDNSRNRLAFNWEKFKEELGFKKDGAE